MTRRARMGMRPGLETMRELLAALGHPEKGLVAVQVAGTNGKGSTSRLLQAILSSQGLRTGLFTSPHIVCLRERFLIGEEAISEIECADLLEELRPAAESCQASFFEICTALAVLWFQRRGVDLAVLETGLGGRLDSVTALPAQGLLLTGASLDHTAILGNTVEAIWTEKVAALRPGKPIFTPPQPESLRVILDAAAAKAQCEVVWCDQPAPLEPPISGEGQRRNLDLAWGAACRLLGRVPHPQAVAESLSRLPWPGRVQRLPGTPEVVLDVGHNPEALELLGREIRETRPVLLFACMADKDWPHALGYLIEAGLTELHLFPLATGRAEDPQRIAGYFPQAIVHPDPQTAWIAAERRAREANVPVLVCGSFHTVGALQRLLQAQGRYAFWPEGIVPDPEVPGLG